MTRCDRCYGAKKVSGIGWIEIDCPRCDGLGKIADSYKDVEDIKEELKIEAKQQKKGK